jgi:hypothetical protein
MQWIDKQIARLKKEKKISLRKEKVKSHKMILNALIIVNQDIMLRIITRNRNRMEKLK